MEIESNPEEGELAVVKQEEEDWDGDEEGVGGIEKGELTAVKLEEEDWDGKEEGVRRIETGIGVEEAATNDADNWKVKDDWKIKEDVEEKEETQDLRKILRELLTKNQDALMKASQACELVTETRTKLDALLAGNESCEKKLQPVGIKKHSELEKEVKDTKRWLYKQRKKINGLKKQHEKVSAGLSEFSLAIMDRQREAQLKAIDREQSVLRDMEDRLLKEQKQLNETTLADQYAQEVNTKNEVIQNVVKIERQLSELVSAHGETRAYIEAELNRH